MSARGRSSSPSGRGSSRGRSTSPAAVAIPETATDRVLNRGEIDQIVGKVEEDRSDSGKHLQLLPADYVLHKKNSEGITTRAVWLDWEGHKDKFITKSTGIPTRLADTMTGILWKRKQNGNSFSSMWVKREFTATMIDGTISYKSSSTGAKDAAGAVRTMWLTPDCMLHRIEGACFGRACCFRIIWPSGFDLILSALSPLDCSDWFEYLCVMHTPPREVMQERERRAAGYAPIKALWTAGVRSQKLKELKPYGVQKIYLKISQSHGIIFDKRRDEALFESMDILDPVGEMRKWGLGYPNRRYAQLPEIHYASVPSISPYCDAWDAMLSTFPTRHQEELRRFLVAHGYNVAKASLALRRHIDWRSMTLPIRPSNINKELAKGKCFVRGLDHFGHPVIYYFTQRQDPRLRSINESIQAVLYRVEQALARLPARDGKVTLVVVREGATLANRDVELVLPLSKILEEHYPERLHCCLVYPARAIFRTYIAVAGGTALTADTINRIVPLPEKTDFHFYIPKQFLLEGLGGVDKFNFSTESAKTGAVLTPALWTLPEARDYYPPPADAESSYVASSGGGELVGVLGDDGESKAEPEWVCPNCSFRQCKLCRVAGRADTFYGGWKPMDLSAFPDPVVENASPL